MTNEKVTTKSREILSTDDAEISRLIKGLKRVSAPPDFDVRVRARIAKGRPAETSGFRFPVLVQYAMGFGAIALVVGLFGLIWMSTRDRANQTPVAVSSPRAEQRIVDTPANSNIEVIAPAEPATGDRAGANPPAPSGPGHPSIKDSDRPENPLGSDNDLGKPTRPDQALSLNNLHFPKGVDPRHANVPKPKGFDNGPQTQTKDVLAFLGINAKFTGGAWRVDSVKSLTQAERVGVKAGDVIESVNDKPVSAKTTFGRSFSVTNLQVKRDGQVVKLDLLKK